MGFNADPTNGEKLEPSLARVVYETLLLHQWRAGTAISRRVFGPVAIAHAVGDAGHRQLLEEINKRSLLPLPDLHLRGQHLPVYGLFLDLVPFFVRPDLDVLGP